MNVRTEMRAELVSLDHCAVPFLSCAAVSLCWYNNTFTAYIFHTVLYEEITTTYALYKIEKSLPIY